MSCDFTALANVDPEDPDQSMRLLQECTRTLTDPTLWFWAIVFTVVGALVGWFIGKRKNAVTRDVILGAALGPIGWLISLVLPSPRPPPSCPACQRVVAAGDAHCRHCGAKLTTSA
jgi:hypothetical protein